MKTSVRRNYSFTKSFLATDELNKFAELWAEHLAPSFSEFKAQKIIGAELCSRIVLKVHESLFENSWRNGKRKVPVKFSADENHSALNILGEFKIRSLPDTAAEALLRWGRGEIQLKVFSELPSPLEVLELQSRGIRCVSVFLEAEQIRTFKHEGRDFFSFLIHDLIHAQLMTESIEDFKHQVKFACWLKNNWALLSTDLSIEALTELEYMASDMNSHIVHLIKTFKSWVERQKPELLSKGDWFANFSAAEDFDEEFLVHWRRLNQRGQDSRQVDQMHSELLEFWKRLPL